MEWHKLHPGFVCKLCHFPLDDKKSLKKHSELHKTKSSRSDCVLCDKSFSRLNALRAHVQTHVRMHLLDDF